MWLTQRAATYHPLQIDTFSSFPKQDKAKAKPTNTQALQLVNRITVPVTNFKSFSLKFDYLDSKQP